MWHSRPPRDPPLFMANTILYFHFDYRHPSLNIFVVLRKGANDYFFEVLKADPSINNLVFRLSTFPDLVDVPPHLVRFAWHYHYYNHYIIIIIIITKHPVE